MPDGNVLVSAHREHDAGHEFCAKWLEDLVNGPEPFALSALVAVAFLRIVTNKKAFKEPTPLPVALGIIETLSAHPRCRVVSPGESHLELVVRLCREVGATGALVADAQHAALAIAEGCTWVTRDADFAAFEPLGLRWQHLAVDQA